MEEVAGLEKTLSETFLGASFDAISTASRLAETSPRRLLCRKEVKRATVKSRQNELGELDDVILRSENSRCYRFHFAK